jgi:hypothetical protein
MMMTRRNTSLWLAALALLAFAARAGLAVHLHAWRSPNAMEHRSIAAALIHGSGFTFGDWRYYGPTSVQSPTMPFLLAGLFDVFGDAVPPDGSLTGANRAYFAVMLFNAAAGAALVYLTYAAARTVGANAVAGVLAAGLVAVWPTQVYAACSVQAISLITCLLMAMVVLYYRAVQSGSVESWIGYAVVATLAAMTEPVFLPAMVASGGLMLVTRQLTWFERGRNAAVLAFTAAALIGPWAVRNYLVHGALIPIKGSTWVNIWKGNNDFATGTDRPRMTPAEEAHNLKLIAEGKPDLEDRARQYDMLDLSQKMALSNQPEAVRERIFKGYAVSWIKAHPKRYVQLCGIRLLKTLTVDWDNPKSLYKSYLFARGSVLLMTVAGLWVAWRGRWSLAYPAVVAACALGTYTLTVTAARFAFPFEPLQLILGAAFVVAVVPWGSLRTDRGARPDSEPTMSVAVAR